MLLVSLPFVAGAQQIKQGYVDKGICGSAFPEALKSWEKGQKWSDDDNFYISRVKPHQRFRNQATQVNPSLNEENDKKLIFWVPINNQDFNALPDGVFDSEVFPMWSYITHYGNWSSPLVRVPGGFLDVAHKNGVPVSALASVAYGNISKEWKDALTSLTEVGAEKLSDYLLYYGVDGIGYNSEFSTTSTLIAGLMDLHENTLKLMKDHGNPIADIIWYDGTNKAGKITFDRGLASHNKDLWGYGDNIRSSLFLNYNWNYSKILESTVANAKEYGRTPLDIYCGINMQGREPHNSSKEIWTLLEQYPVSIGLWGAHSENMFFESRAEQGSSPLKRQRTYLNRMMNWFTNGTHNPIASLPTTNSLIYSAAKDDFSGMSKMMSARSALKWNLDDEPFITYFNLGNGRFFNWNGVRCHDSEWYNIASQDYLPTWMWWFSSSFLGRDAADLPADGLDAEFIWDDAWNGGSTIRVAGNADNEYLHLFKTEFPLKAGDEITFRYKLLNGSADAFIAMSLKGDEANPIAEEHMKVMDADALTNPLTWIERKFTVGSDIVIPDGGEVAMIALHFKNASDLDMRFGEFSIKRPSALKASIETPIVESTRILSARHDGVDAKIIFNMPNDKGNDVCYNSDVNTSLFKLYAQQEYDGPVLMGVTTSWAGLMFSVPNQMGRGAKYRFGVSALALDHHTESDISWGEWLDPSVVYTISDDILISDGVIKPNEMFEIRYADFFYHEKADWTLIGPDGKLVAESKDAIAMYVHSGLPKPGIYDLVVKGFENSESGRIETERVLKGFVQVTGDESGDVPQILSLECQGCEVREGMNDFMSTAIFLNTTTPKIEYRVDAGGSTLPRGVKVGDNGLGFRFKDTELDPKESFAVSFWFKPEKFSHKSVHALNIRHKGDPWAVNNWGWMWHTLTEDGRSDAFTIRMASGKDASYRFDGMKLYPGAWYHMVYSFEFDENGGVKPALFINGERQKITSWSLGDEEQDGDVEFAGPVGAWKNDNVVAFGGYLHKSGSVRGNVDNFMVWDKALAEEDAALAMADAKADALPEGVIGFFDFESDTDKEFLFENKASGKFKAGIHGYQDTEVEGQGKLEWRVPEFCTGCPFTSGNSFSMTPVVSWYMPGASVIERQDNREDGYIILSYPYETESIKGFSSSMFVENEYGLSEKELSIFLPHQDAVSIVETKNTLDVFPRIFDSEIAVRVAEAGRITLSLFSMEGKCMLSNSFNTDSDDSLKIYPNVSAGAYILRAEKDGALLGIAKLLHR